MRWCGGLLLLLCAACAQQRAPEVAAFCPGQAPVSGATECRIDDDCVPTARCEAPPSDDSVGSATQAIVAPMPPCIPLTTCTVDAQCAAGSVCEPFRSELLVMPGMMQQLCPAGARVCLPACTCAADERCLADGHCELIPCDAAGAPACPAGSACMPGVGDPGVELSRAAMAGCVRIPCDQPGGVTCEPDWTCDPARAPMHDEPPPWGHTAGCAPIPCGAGYTCEGSLVCYPDGASSAVSFEYNTFATRADGRWVDAHGCVQPNCEEGWQCSTLAPTECVVGDARADKFGCREIRCDEPGGADCEALTDGLHICDPSAQNDSSNLARWGCARTFPGGGPSSGVDAGTSDPGTTGGTPAQGGSGSAGGSSAPAPTSMRGDGPLQAACSSDVDCACGSCVLGRCAARPGTCVPR